VYACISLIIARPFINKYVQRLQSDWDSFGAFNLSSITLTNCFFFSLKFLSFSCFVNQSSHPLSQIASVLLQVIEPAGFERRHVDLWDRPSNSLEDALLKESDEPTLTTPGS
jgi:hypothetical protein